MSLFRKVIKITAWDSPNVRLGVAQERAGMEPTGEMLIPGVLPYTTLQRRLATWDDIRQCIGLRAEFWEGADVLLYPPMWLDRASRLADVLRGRVRQAQAIGIDPAEGGDKTTMAAVDHLGLIELVGKKTPNTAVITSEAIAFGKKHGVPPRQWIFDRGGGGQQHADVLRQKGYNVRTVAFGESVTPELRRGKGIPFFEDVVDAVEERYAYTNRRAELYGEFARMLDPASEQYPDGFAIPDEYFELRRQLSMIPKLLDPEGRLMLPPKRRRPGQKPVGVGGVKTLMELLGCSPDEADAVVLAVYGLRVGASKTMAGPAC